MTTYWFKPKRYGYGATPVTWQGWAVTGATLAVVLASVLLLPSLGRDNQAAFFAFLAVDAMAIAALWIVSRRKTDGEWRWRWRGGSGAETRQ